MRYFVVILYMFFIVFCVSGQLYSQDKTDNQTPDTAINDSNSDSKSEVPQTQPKPAKVYDLMPKFQKDMKCKEYVNITLIAKGLHYEKDTYKLNYDFVIKEMKEYYPSKIKLTKALGDCNEYTDYCDKEPFEFDTKIDINDVSFNIDKDYKLTIEDKEDWEFIFVFCPGALFTGFYPTVKTTKVGDEWDADEVIPLMFINREDEEFTVSENKLELESVDEQDGKSFAKIGWVGKCKFVGDDIVWDYEWSVETLFDISERRTVSIKSNIKYRYEIDGLTPVNTTIKVYRKINYETIDKVDKQEIQPKDDDE